jgi:choline dehydrogenase-like flavoprotein
MPPPARTGAAPPTSDLTKPEKRLFWLLLGHAVWSAGAACLYVVEADTTMLGFVPNSFAKDILFATVSLLGAADVQRRGWLALVVAAGYLGLVAGQLATLLLGGAPDPEVPLIEVSATVALLVWMAVDLALIAWFFLWWCAAVKARNGLRYLHPVGFGALSALAEVTVEGRAEQLTPDEVARNVDRYLAELEAPGKGRVQLAFFAVALWPLLTLRPPLPVLSPAARKAFLQKRFLDEKARLKLPGLVRRALQAAVRTAAQMTYLGYYGDRRTWPSIGFTPYAERDGATPAPPPAVAPLRSLPAPPANGGARYDAIVIGSGAAGGILAHRFAAAGRRVLVLERGPHLDPREFTDDEVRQYLHLYNEGALQLATNFSLQVLQGMCVGGGTTINNGLCLQPPGPILDEWEAYGIERDGLEQAIRHVREWLGIRRIDPAWTSVAARGFGMAAGRAGLPGRVELMDVNISAGCRGCGYCNIGCAYDAKLAMLDAVLPWAQRDYPGNLDVLADFHVERIAHANGRATGVVGAHRGGPAVTLAADEIVIAAGAIGSSALLLRSRLGGDHVGEGLHFNINSPLTAEFPDAVDAFDGIQMSHAYVPPGDPPEHLVETWFNPPATQALATPGWFDDHYALMHRFRHLACAGVLVGTTTPGRVTSGKGEFTYEPSAADRDRVLAGLVDAARIFLEAGASRVMPATIGFREYRPGDDLQRLPDAIRRSGDLLLTSAHPQGGNAVGKVVDGDFRVTGTENLYLCDASAFPSCVRVNPQLTVMGLAEYAARRILSAAAPSAAAPAAAR